MKTYDMLDWSPTQDPKEDESFIDFLEVLGIGNSDSYYILHNHDVWYNVWIYEFPTAAQMEAKLSELKKSYGRDIFEIQHRTKNVIYLDTGGI